MCENINILEFPAYRQITVLTPVIFDLQSKHRRT